MKKKVKLCYSCGRVASITIDDDTKVKTLVTSFNQMQSKKDNLILELKSCKLKEVHYVNVGDLCFIEITDME